MNYLKTPGSEPIPLQKNFISVGTGTAFDVSVASESAELLFSLQTRDQKVCLIPGDGKVWVNGRRISAEEELRDCDRIEWRGSHAVFLGGNLLSPLSPREGLAVRSLEFLETLLADLERQTDPSLLLQRVLGLLVELSGAEKGYLLSEKRREGKWGILAFEAGTGSLIASPELWISNTVVNEAIRLRKTVHVESLVGHPWQAQASVLGAELFSIGCFPLCVGERVYGCVYLCTSTPGRSIKKESLRELSLLASQATLLLLNAAEQSRLPVVLQSARTTASSSRLLFSPESPMASLVPRLDKVAASDLNVIIRGETGTGKELIATELHEKSARAQGPFVAINCGAIPPTLIESMLFGYVKGAFTGAHRDAQGKFVQAQGGTLFLDEIGDLPLDLQVKLLRVLQEKKVEPIGSDKSIPVDVRVISATHCDLESQIAKGKFRQDLYYRLNGMALSLPSLKERGDDVILLAQAFLRERAPGLRLSAPSESALRGHPWPGNVRELQQVISRAAVLADGEEIQPGDLELVSPSPAPGEDEGVEAASARPLWRAQDDFTRKYIERVLKRHEGIRSRAAAELGISERTLYRLLAASDNAVSLN